MRRLDIAFILACYSLAALAIVLRVDSALVAMCVLMGLIVART